MGDIEVVDRGSSEIVVFLSGEIDSTMDSDLADALQEVSLLERLDDLHRVVVDTREVTSFGKSGLRFLSRLEERGRAEDFELAFSMTSQPVQLALEDARWPFATGQVLR